MLSDFVIWCVTFYWLHFPEAHASDNQKTTSAADDAVTEHSYSSMHEDIERVTNEGRETNGTRTTGLLIGKFIDIFRQPFKPLMPKQHDRHFAGDIVKCIWCNENIIFSVGCIDNKIISVQVMDCHRPGEMLFHVPNITKVSGATWRWYMHIHSFLVHFDNTELYVDRPHIHVHVVWCTGVHAICGTRISKYLHNYYTGFFVALLVVISLFSGAIIYIKYPRKCNRGKRNAYIFYYMSIHYVICHYIM